MIVQGGVLSECTIAHLQVLLVDCDYALEEALDALRESMDDSIVAIDLEWTPDVVSGCYSPIALMQLASSTRVVLIRLCCMDGIGLPAAHRLDLELRCYQHDKVTLVSTSSTIGCRPWRCVDPPI